MKRIIAAFAIALGLLIVPSARTSARPSEVIFCGGGYINEEGCVAKQCQVCNNGRCLPSYEVIVHCPGDPPK